jgi:hypothetical protein
VSDDLADLGAKVRWRLEQERALETPEAARLRNRGVRTVALRYHGDAGDLPAQPSVVPIGWVRPLPRAVARRQSTATVALVIHPDRDRAFTIRVLRRLDRALDRVLGRSPRAGLPVALER